MRFKNGEDFVKNLLSEYCPDPFVSNTIRLDTYFKKAHNLFQQSIDYIKAGQEPQAYIHLYRFAQLVVALPKHNAYSSKTYSREKAQYKKKLENAMIKLEQMKPQLIKDYNDSIKREAMRPPQPQPEQKNDAQPPDNSAPSAPPLPADDSEGKVDESNANAQSNTLDRSQMDPSSRWSSLRIPDAPPSPQNQPQSQPPPPASPDNRSESSFSMDSIFDNGIQNIVIPNDLINGFIKYAARNTRNDIETCAVLTGKFVKDSYIITHVIVPKQHGTANTVQTLHEEELIGVQEKHDLITLGWIHTHPSQSCFLSSVDMHCQLSYQIMMPTAIAIVHAPRDKTSVFTLTKPGIDLLAKCSCTGFHRHEAQRDIIYQIAQHAVFSNRHKTKFIDLRKK